MSDSETAFPRFENHFLILCLCFVIIVFFRVCLFDQTFSIVCLCRSFLIEQLCNTIVFLLPRLSLHTRFRMMDAIFGLEFSNFLNLSVLCRYLILGHRLSWFDGLE